MGPVGKCTSRGSSSGEAVMTDAENTITTRPGEKNVELHTALWNPAAKTSSITVDDHSVCARSGLASLEAASSAAVPSPHTRRMIRVIHASTTPAEQRTKDRPCCSECKYAWTSGLGAATILAALTVCWLACRWATDAETKCSGRQCFEPPADTTRVVARQHSADSYLQRKCVQTEANARWAPVLKSKSTRKVRRRWGVFEKVLQFIRCMLGCPPICGRLLWLGAKRGQSTALL